MGHIQQFEEMLREKLAQGVTEEAIAWIKNEILTSYRNGLAMKRTAGKETGRALKKDR
jgi:rubrerythrin